MTWSLSHTVAYSTNADLHTAMVYLFDTALPALSQITTSAHPDASSFKRRFQRVTPNNLENGTNMTEYFWATWNNTSPDTLYLYEDATYTTVPGDTATDTTTSVSSNLALTVFAGESVKFWTSDQNAKALLVTRGKQVLFWEPGFANANYELDETWDGTVDYKGSVIFPGTYNSYCYGANRPISTSGGGTSEYPWRPALSVTNGTGYNGRDQIMMNVPFMWAGSTNTAGSVGAGMLFGGVGNDVGMYRPYAAANSEVAWQNTTGAGALWLVDGRYYLAPSNKGLSWAQTIFDFGTSEPDLT
jgi:hypothetical protein